MKATKHSIFGKILLLTVIGTLSTSSVRAYPPDNAAVLYYRAFMLYEAEDGIKSALDDYRQGRIGRTEEIERYLAKNAPIINLVLDATRIAHCDWGLDYSQGTEVVLPPQNKAREIFFLVAAEAARQADTGHPRQALEHCVCMYKMANHLNERPLICYLVATAVAAATNKCVVRFLSEMPPDAETLTWLRDELAALDRQPLSLDPVLDWKREAGIISMAPERIAGAAQAALDEGDMKTRVLERIRTADPQFYARNILYWNNFMGRVRAAFHQPYHAARAALLALDKQPGADFDRNPDATLTVCFAPTFATVHLLSARLQAQSNAIRTAVGVYLSKAQTGRLPETLPSGAPGDPFSSQPLQYEKADDRFVLRWQDKVNAEKPGATQYEFKIKS
jgi:hypothetical protein